MTNPVGIEEIPEGTTWCVLRDGELWLYRKLDGARIHMQMLSADA